MDVIKASGERVPFDPERVLTSITRTGASRATAEAVLEHIRPKFSDGMTTRKLYRLVREELKKENACYSCRYGLREAILNLGPAGFKFEKYVVSILRAYGYDAMNPHEDMRGACVEHEVDVVAKKQDREIFMEAKFRNDQQDFVGLKDVMATWSRYLDLIDGSAMYEETPLFNECWLITNARFSRHAQQFGGCKGMKLVGWDSPKEEPLQQMVDHVALYPITVLPDLQKEELDWFARHGYMLCREVAELDPEELSERSDMSVRRAEELIELSGKVIEENVFSQTQAQTA